MSQIVVVGADQAGGQVTASLRQLKCEQDILLFGEENHLPYQRPLLSKQYLAGEQEQSRVYLRAEKFYQQHNIDLRIGQSINKIDTDNNQVFTSSGETIDYENLVLATGSRPRRLNIPGSDLQGILYLRSLDDVNAIKPEIIAGQKLVIIGGGYIGLEVASVAVEAGMEVTVVEMEDRILKRVTTEEMSAFYHQLHSQRGVNILLNTGIQGFNGQGKVSQALCGEQSLDADLVIIGVGIIPNTELAAAAGIECDNGIVTDDHCRTSVANIYAAGDCSNHPNPLLGRRLRLESVPNAMDQAKVVAANIMGQDKTYAAVPWFWSDQYEHKLQMVGFSSDGDRQIIRGNKDEKKFSVIHLQGNRLVAVDAVNAAKDFMAGRQLYGKNFDLDKLGDTQFEVKDCVLDAE